MRSTQAVFAVLLVASTFACTAGERTLVAPAPTRAPRLRADRVGHAKAGAARARGSAGALFALATPSNGIAVEDMTAGITADSLARTLVGPGVAISNVTYTGAPAAAGVFASDPLTVGITSGIVLSTGAAATVIGPNQLDDATTDWSLPGDAQLSALVGNNPTFDASVLEFDFVPDSSVVYLSAYVFGSEEYNEFVNSDFNDAMAFYVNGVNCALVGGKPVSINAINNGYMNSGDTVSNPDLFRNNALPNGGGSINTELDGLTRVLTCAAPVTKGVSNHLKLAIADVYDGLFDSDVFIGAGALTTIPPVPVPVPHAVPAYDVSGVDCAPVGATITLDGSGSNEPGSAIVSWQWHYGASVIGTGETFTRHFDVGTWPLSLVVTDVNGATATTPFTITVPAPPPSGTSLTETPDHLWPPNHKYAAIAVAASVVPACGSTALPLIGGWVESNEPDNMKATKGKKGDDEGDGNTIGDIQVARPNHQVLRSSNANPRVPFNPVTDKLELRAERAGNDSARVYTIVMTVDGVPTDTATVVVAHDQHGHGSAHGDGNEGDKNGKGSKGDTSHENGGSHSSGDQGHRG